MPSLVRPDGCRLHYELAGDLRVEAAQPDHPRGQRRQWEAMLAWDAFDRLPQITAPTLVLARRIPGAELRWLDGAGHLFWPERPEVADRLVLDFIEGHRDA